MTPPTPAEIAHARGVLDLDRLETCSIRHALAAAETEIMHLRSACNLGAPQRPTIDAVIDRLSETLRREYARMVEQE